MSHGSLNELLELFEEIIRKRFKDFPESSKIEITFGHNKTTNVLVRIFSKKRDLSGRMVFEPQENGEYIVLKSLNTSKKKVNQMASAE